MDDALLDVILGRVDDSELSEEATDLLVAACLGDDALAEAVAGSPPARPRPTPPPSPNGDGPDGSRRPGTFLAAVTVEGFRGVGPASTLTLPPGPGLTVVVGRNGSGKSSFAEGLQMLLTGSLPRFESYAVLRDGWRNLHQRHPTRVRAEFHIEGAVGATIIERSWPEHGDLDDSTVVVRTPDGESHDLDVLGWAEHLSTHRPFLPHDDLESMFEARPSALYDQIATALGLGDLSDAQDRLARHRRELQQDVKSARAEQQDIIDVLDTLDDERADALRELLVARTVDIDAVARLVTGTEPDPRGSVVDVLRRLAHLPGPDPAACAQAGRRLRRAAAELEAVADTEAAQARALAGLLRDALRVHDLHPDTSDCPVCGTAGVLDAIWRDRTTAQIARLEREAAEADRAHHEAADAVRAARALIEAVPPVLRDRTPAPDPGVDIEGLATAWAAWSTPPDVRADRPDDLRRLADHLSGADALAEEVEAVRRAATDELARREDRWTPIAERTASWVDRWRQAVAAQQLVAHLEAAERWLKATHDEIRNERFRPIAEQARANWQALRHESNVDLDALRLAGSNTKRRVVLDATVDGADTSALGVMSQGEINALALSVFLPRATMPDSPFRFVVIDDPVQAMDPAKVDGLARVLHEAAQTHQVVVFTHDDRLPNALRRLDLGASIIEVTRRPGSVVQIAPAGDPVSRALSDARAVIRDQKVPPDVKRRVVPGQCRLAVEAAVRDIILRRELAAGRPHYEVDKLLADARSLHDKLALAFGYDPNADVDVGMLLAAVDPRHATAYRDLNAGAHGNYTGSLDALFASTRQLVDALVEELA